MAGPLLAEKAGIPWASTLLSPMSLFSALDAPIFPNGRLTHRRADSPTSFLSEEVSLQR